MNQRDQRFDRAFDAWQSAPVELIESVPYLRSITESLVIAQNDLTPFAVAYRTDRTVLESEMPGLWHDGVSYRTARPIARIRQHLHTGRNQTATRDLLKRAETLKELWDAYRAAAGI